MAFTFEVRHGWMVWKRFQLLVDLDQPSGLNVDADTTILADAVVVVTMASRFGDVGINDDLTATHYVRRVQPYMLAMLDSEVYPMDSRMASDAKFSRGVFAPWSTDVLQKSKV